MECARAPAGEVASRDARERQGLFVRVRPELTAREKT
jgi:hypothetical protein